jgi:integrase/recombinase XerD
LLLNPKDEYWQIQYQFAMLYYTGMRIAELGYLQTKDVNLAKREIRIRAKVLRVPFGKKRETKEISWSPKSHEQRVVPIESRLLPILREFQERREENIWRLYFLSAMGAQVTDHLSRQVKAITGKDDVSLHTFRHTHISHALNRWGRLPAVVQKMVGHKDLATTQLYIHVSREDLHREAMKT